MQVPNEARFSVMISIGLLPISEDFLMSTQITLLQQREIEAKVIGPIFRAFTKEIGVERAKQILSGVIQQLAKDTGCTVAEQFGGNDLKHFEQVIETWNRGDALSLTVIRHDETHLDFNVTRCRFAEMYYRLGLQELGAILSCNRDGALIEGFNPDIHFQRTQTLMQGASHCDFRYRMGNDEILSTNDERNPNDE
jgi:hypothetical protein